MLFQQNDINPCIYKRFCDNWDLEQHGDDFLVCGLTSNLEVLADEFKNSFLAKKAEIVSLKPEHQNEIHFLKRRINVDNFGWHVKGSKVCEKSAGCNDDESLQIDGHSWIEGTGEQSNCGRIDRKVGSAGTLRVPIRCWNLSVYDRTTLRHCLQYEGHHERGSRTDHSLKDKIEENRALPQRTSAMCTEFPLGGKAGRRHPCDRGCRLGWRPKDKVLHVWWSVGNWPVLHSSTLVCDTGNSIAILSRVRGFKAITKGCTEALCVKHLLEHQTARPFKIELWTDSSSAKAIMQRLGPGRRAKHLEVQTMWVQQLNKIGLISLNKLNTQENVADLLTKHVPRAVLDKLAGMMGYTFLDEETQKYQEYTSINLNYGRSEIGSN